MLNVCAPFVCAGRRWQQGKELVETSEGGGVGKGNLVSGHI